MKYVIELYPSDVELLLDVLSRYRMDCGLRSVASIVQSDRNRSRLMEIRLAQLDDTLRKAMTTPPKSPQPAD